MIHVVQGNRTTRQCITGHPVTNGEGRYIPLKQGGGGRWLNCLAEAKILVLGGCNYTKSGHIMHRRRNIFKPFLVEFVAAR